MNIVLYTVPAKPPEGLRTQYGLKVINSPDKFDASGTMVLVPPISTPRYLLAFYNAMLRHEDDVDAVIICGIESCEAASTVQYCTPPGKFFSLNGGLDEEELVSRNCACFSTPCLPRATSSTSDRVRSLPVPTVVSSATISYAPDRTAAAARAPNPCRRSG